MMPLLEAIKQSPVDPEYKTVMLTNLIQQFSQDQLTGKKSTASAAQVRYLNGSVDQELSPQEAQLIGISVGLSHQDLPIPTATSSTLDFSRLSMPEGFDESGAQNETQADVATQLYQPAPSMQLDLVIAEQQEHPDAPVPHKRRIAGATIWNNVIPSQAPELDIGGIYTQTAPLVQHQPVPAVATTLHPLSEDWHLAHEGNGTQRPGWRQWPDGSWAQMTNQTPVLGGSSSHGPIDQLPMCQVCMEVNHQPLVECELPKG